MTTISTKDMETIKALAMRIGEKLEGVTVEPVEVSKNNGIRLGLKFRREGEEISPTLYPQGSDLTDAKDNLDEVAVRLAQIYLDHKKENEDGYFVEAVKVVREFETSKDRLRLMVINEKSNQGYIQGRPYRKIMGDLVVLVYVEIGSDEEGKGTGQVTITNDLLDAWKKDFDEVYDQAYENMRDQVFESTMAQIMIERFGLTEEEAAVGFLIETLVFSNKGLYRGAGVLPVVIDDLKERFGRFIILPSSIHEFIVMPVDDEEFENGVVGCLNDMVGYISNNEIDLEDKLSDHAYYYDGSQFVI